MVKARSKESEMARNKTAIAMGAQQAIGAGLVDGFLESAYSVVATSLRASEPLRSTPDLSGCVISISAALADNAIGGANGSFSTITKGEPNTVTRHLAIEHAKQGTRSNAVAPSVVDTPLHEGSPKERLRALLPMMSTAQTSGVVAAICICVTHAEL